MGFARGTQVLNFHGKQLAGSELPRGWLDVWNKAEWVSADFESGDVVVFDSSIVHGSFV